MEAGREFSPPRESGRKGTQERGEGSDPKKGQGLPAGVMFRAHPTLFSSLSSLEERTTHPKKPLNARQCERIGHLTSLLPPQPLLVPQPQPNPLVPQGSIAESQMPSGVPRAWCPPPQTLITYIGLCPWPLDSGFLGGLV